MIDMSHGSPKELLEDTHRALVTRFPRVDRDQVVHHHGKSSSEAPLEAQNTVEIVLLYPGGTEKAKDRGNPIVQHACAVKFLRPGHLPITRILGGKCHHTLAFRQKQIPKQTYQKRSRDNVPSFGPRVEAQK